MRNTMENFDAFFPEYNSSLHDDMCTDPELVDTVGIGDFEFAGSNSIHGYEDPPVKDLEEIGYRDMASQLDIEYLPLFTPPTIEATSSLASSGTITITNPMTYYLYLPSITSQWVPPECPNGEVEIGEECDDGNWINTDACITDEENDLMCVEASCGDGFVWEGTEECDSEPNCNNDTCEWILPPTATPTEEPTPIATATGAPPSTPTPFPENIYISGNVFLDTNGNGEFDWDIDTPLNGEMIYASSPCQNTYSFTDEGYFSVNVDASCDADGDGEPDPTLSVLVWGDAGASGYEVLLPEYDESVGCEDGYYCLEVQPGFPYTGNDFLYDEQTGGLHSQTPTPQPLGYFDYYYGSTPTPTPIPEATPQQVP
ncbi:hypothetical protein GF362_05395 [Candidatus Dojkabacteria bacterium]|nr:hypothetical protein [Candidatus Dojkabacteria bacterium]